MEKHISFVFCFIFFAVATMAEAKKYRTDYTYDWPTDAFYKLHVEHISNEQRAEVCESEGAKLMPPMSYKELSQFRAKLRQQMHYNEEDSGLQQNDSDERQSIFDLELEARDMVEMSCQVTTRDGYVKTSAVYRDQPFLCKVEAKDVPYDSQCRLHAKGYKFFPSIGSCYKVSSEKQTWDAAAAQCKVEGAHLAIINSEHEALELKNLTNSVVPSEAYVIIGFKFLKGPTPETSTFKTVFNQTLDEAGFSTWAIGEPNHLHGAEPCGSLNTREAKLNDIGCHSHYYICEKEVICQCKP